MEVPTATSLRDIYPEDAVPVQAKRWERILAKFKETYGKPAEFVARSPGRVNIIGEHIDYSLYEVLPMAITADFVMAVAVRPSEEKPRVRIANVQSAKFPSREFEIPTEGTIPIDASEHEWTNYFKSGLKGVTELLSKKQGKQFVSVGMDVMCDGTVPSGGGLSSSASFTCTTALGVLTANGETKVNKKELCELAIVSEREVGVNSGGMDQAASVFSLRGSALYVSFKPALDYKTLEFPHTDPELTFVTAQSFVAADKHVTAPVCYNLRVVECTLAAVFLSKVFGLKELPQDSSPLGVSLRGFHDTYFEEKQGVADNNKTSVADFEDQLNKLVQLAGDYLPQEEGYSRSDICALLGVSEDELNQRYMSKFPVRAEKFKLRQRALHVFTEALRVIKFRQILSSPPSDGQELIKALGDLMNDTQTSCRDVYDCSCPELDELCDLARGAGAAGSRLTGAGWGGCSVHLVPKDKVEAVKQAWEENYYKKRFPDITKEKLEEAVVVSKPGSGSMVLKVVGDSIV
ncbi:galactokinase-like protein [Karstenula rhodostoma CBS 690.94]|uniref:Galactokinase n=1 Tax=Karstenula rhodostoma CBS 690.94 TaxID=1392251 RepID=A0A9P4PJV8_9PLEO|nr:galactokinase-like protein [Karstenula rhodostoma CBS 690.94]